MFLNQLASKLMKSWVNYSPEEFNYVVGKTPFSTTPEIVIVLLSYFFVIFLLHRFMSKRKGFQLKYLFAIHNLILSFISLVLLVLLVENLVPRLFEHGIFWGVCGPDLAQDRRLEFYYYVNYIIKFVELLDTVFLVLKKKDLTFLHVYHHSLTALLCFTQLYGNTTVQWVPITLNLFVHVLMYYYYFLTAVGGRAWWKKYLTTMQIIQFVIDLVACYFCMYIGLTHDWYQNPLDCHGSRASGYFGCFLLSSYLYLFIEFFSKTYSKGGKLETQKIKKIQ